MAVAVPAKVALIGSSLKALVPLLLKKKPSSLILFNIIAPVESVDISVATPLFGLCKISLLPLLISTFPAKVALPAVLKVSLGVVAALTKNFKSGEAPPVAPISQ